MIKKSRKTVVTVLILMLLFTFSPMEDSATQDYDDPRPSSLSIGE
ncbi:hypothetical protein [Salipaludibacillus aurantiacus]|nr:hypothetical protein [Salipaludibacillus aurantiacus]